MLMWRSDIQLLAAGTISIGSTAMAAALPATSAEGPPRCQWAAAITGALLLLLMAESPSA
jgi:uncharacterized membrane protein YbjE (DUF340 family)